MVVGKRIEDILMTSYIKCARRHSEIFGCDKEAEKYLYIRPNNSR